MSPEIPDPHAYRYGGCGSVTSTDTAAAVNGPAGSITDTAGSATGGTVDPASAARTALRAYDERALSGQGTQTLPVGVITYANTADSTGTLPHCDNRIAWRTYENSPKQPPARTRPRNRAERRAAAARTRTRPRAR